MRIKKQTDITAGLDKKKIITYLRKNKSFFEKEFGITKIALFGSYARNEHTAKSDIDILIEMKAHNFRERLRFCHILESHFNKKVDVLYFDAVRKFILRNVQKDVVYA